MAYASVAIDVRKPSRLASTVPRPAAIIDLRIREESSVKLRSFPVSIPIEGVFLQQSPRVGDRPKKVCDATGCHEPTNVGRGRKIVAPTGSFVAQPGS